MNEIKNNLRKLIKLATFKVLGSDSLLRWRLQRLSNSGKITILNFHRVALDDGSDYRPLDPELFDELIGFIKKEFSIITISEINEKFNKPKLILSFDDGYRDFILNAVPILAKHGVRANQNIIPQCVDSGLPPLNVLAQDFVGKAPMQLVKKLQIDGFSAPLDANFGWKLSHFLKMRPQAEQDQLARQLLPQFYDWDEFKPTPMMTLEEVRNLEGHEIGAHSYAHSSMEYESDDYLDADIIACSKYFKKNLDIDMSIYAFPNGSYREGQIERVISHGVDHVLLVGEKFDEGRYVHTRFTLDGHSCCEVKFKALGGFCHL